MMMLVRPSMSVTMAFWMSCSVAGSTLLVASSSISTLGSWARALAKQISCFCPVERVAPRSAITSSKPLGSFSMNSRACTISAAARTFSRGIRAPSLMFSSTVLLKMKASWRTIAMLSRRAGNLRLRMSMPSIFIEPASGS